MSIRFPGVVQEVGIISSLTVAISEEDKAGDLRFKAARRIHGP